MYYRSILLLLLLAALLYSCGKTETESQPITKGNTIPVRVMALQQGNFSTTIAASGTFSTNDETLLSFKVGGIVSSILVEEGDAVKKGQILATLDLTEIQSGLHQYKFAYQQA